MLLWHGSRLTNWTGILSQGCLFGLLFFSTYYAVTEHVLWSVNELTISNCKVKLLYWQTTRLAHCSPRSTFNRLHVWKGGLLCWYVFQKCKLLLCHKCCCSWCAAFMWGRVVLNICLQSMSRPSDLWSKRISLFFMFTVMVNWQFLLELTFSIIIYFCLIIQIVNLRTILEFSF